VQINQQVTLCVSSNINNFRNPPKYPRDLLNFFEHSEKNSFDVCLKNGQRLGLVPVSSELVWPWWFRRNSFVPMATQ